MIRGEGGDSVRSVTVHGTDRAETLLPATLTVRHELPLRTIVKVLVVLAVLWLLAQLWSLLLSLFVAFLLTAALDPPVSRLEQRGVPRAASVAIIVLAFAGVVAGSVLLVVPPLVEQGTQLAEAFPGYLDRFQLFAQTNSEIVARVQGVAAGSEADPQAVASRFLAVSA